MHLNLNPIEKHKSEIQRRISQLEQKFRERQAPKPYPKRNRDYLHDQNKTNFPPGHLISKTVEVRGKIKAQGEGKTNRESCYRNPQAKQPLSETGLIKNVKDNRQPKIQGKDQKIKQLYEMMRLILEGQKNIEKEINQLKQQNTRQSANKSRIDGQRSFIQPTALQSSIQKLSLSKQKGIEKSNKKVPMSSDQSILIREQIELKQPKSKQKKGRTKKDYNMDGYLEELKGQCKDGHRYCVGQQWKARIWSEVQGRVKESEKEYKDTIHRNNKHQYDHLINTFELQRKLKDDLIDKVYQQCNPQIYK